MIYLRSMEAFSLRVWAYDLDFNVVNTPHKIIHLDESFGSTWKPISVRLDDFEQKWYKDSMWTKYRWRDNDIYKAFIEQSDEWVHGKHALLHDLRENNHGPSMDNFKQNVCLAEPCSIITARQSSQSWIQESLYMRLSDELTEDQKKQFREYVLYKYDWWTKNVDILKEYVAHIACYAMYNKQLSHLLWFEAGGSWNTPERKSITVLHDIHRFETNEIGIRKQLWENMVLPKEYGYSDDEHGNITQIADRIILERSLWWLKDRKFTLFHTHNSNTTTKISIRDI